MRHLIRASWVVLICCFIVKLFGGNYFEIVCENENFVMICNFIDNNFWLKVIVYAIICVINVSLVLLAIIEKRKFSGWQNIIILLIIVKSIMSWYLQIVTFCLDIIIGIVIPFVICRKMKRVIIGQFLFISFQVISLITKNVGLTYLNNETTLVALILNIDVTIMLFLYYLYTNKKEEI